MALRRSQSWNLTQEAFERLLAQLSVDREQAAQEYERLRQKLCSFFDWRGSISPETHADETLDRVARKLDEGEPIEHLGRYVYGVARRVLLEWHRERAREQAALDEARLSAATPGTRSDLERRLACLERCLEAMAPQDRALILEYHLLPQGSALDARQRLARQRGIPYGTLKTRAHRARARLEDCLRDCLGAAETGTGSRAASPPGEGTEASMGKEPERDQEMVDYLLGSLPPEAQTAVEERYFTDDACYEALLATADELVQAYLAGSLTPAERERFEGHFLASPLRRERFEFVRDMLTAARRVSVRHRPGPSARSSAVPWWTLAAVLVLAAVLSALFLLRPRRLAPEVRQSPPPSATPTAAPGETGEGPGEPAGGVHTVLVPADMAKPVAVELPSSARSLRVTVAVAAGRLAYDAVVSRQGRMVWSERDLLRSPETGAVVVTIPADVFGSGDYVLAVEGEPLRAGEPSPPRLVTLRIARQP